MPFPDAVIRIYRPGSRVGVVILNPAFELEVDGASLGSLRPKQVRSIAVPAGTHEVKVRSLGYRIGRKKSVTVLSGETVDLVLPHEWVMSVTGQIRLHEASRKDHIALEALIGSPEGTQSGED